MSDLYKALRDLLFLAWLVYITISFTVAAFAAESLSQGLLAILVGMFVFIISVGIYDKSVD